MLCVGENLFELHEVKFAISFMHWSEKKAGGINSHTNTYHQYTIIQITRIR